MKTYTFRFLTPAEKEQGEMCQHPAHQQQGDAPVATIARESDSHWDQDEYFCDAHAQELAEAQGNALAAIYPDEIFQGVRLYLEYGPRGDDDRLSEGGDLSDQEVAKRRKGRASREALFVRRIAHSQGNVVAVFLDENGSPTYAGGGSDEALTSVYFHANSPVNFGSVGRNYLATCCERISRDQARMTGHTELFARLKDAASDN